MTVELNPNSRHVTNPVSDEQLICFPAAEPAPPTSMLTELKSSGGKFSVHCNPEGWFPPLDASVILSATVEPGVPDPEASVRLGVCAAADRAKATAK
jgi:hypothetical protein